MCFLFTPKSYSVNNFLFTHLITKIPDFINKKMRLQKLDKLALDRDGSISVFFLIRIFWWVLIIISRRILFKSYFIFNSWNKCYS